MEDNMSNMEDNMSNMEDNMSNISVNIVSVDGLAPYGTGVSAWTVMT